MSLRDKILVICALLLPHTLVQSSPVENSTTPATVAAPIPLEFDFDYYLPFRSDAHDLFSWQLMKQVMTEQETKNVVISPFSVKLMLSMLAEAAGNNTTTQKELLNTLTDIRSTENLRNFYKKNLQSLRQKNPYYILNLATKIYADAFIHPNQRYAALLHEYYATDIESVDFKNAKAVSQNINDWCSIATQGRLTQLVSEQSVQNSVMIIANVIYFNGLWRRPFDNNFEGVFFKKANDQVRANFIEVTDYFYYHQSLDLGVKMLRLPYKGHQYSMFIVLPKEGLDMQELLGKLANDNLKRMQLVMEDVKIKVTMPKFKFDFENDLRSTLAKLGISDIFTEQASLPGLARGSDVAQRLKVSQMFQKAGIEVNENGTEVYASTVVEIGNKFGGVTIIEEFNVNRPFLFFIEEEATGNIIFAGKVIQPFV